MGVRGLSAWLTDHAMDSANLTMLKGRILIDGTGLAHHILRASPTWHAACGLPPLSWLAPLGGYAEIHCAIVSFLNRLQWAGLVPTVYFDGRATRLKTATIAHRRQGRADLYEAFQAACMDGRTIAVSKMPDPAMLLEQCEYSVAAAGVDVVQCVGEADHDLAHACAAATRAGESCFICAQDSDFLLHADVLYVPFRDLSLLGGHEEGDAVVAMGRVWSRMLLASIAGLSEGQLVDWAILLGNDATSNFRLSFFGAELAEALRHGGAAEHEHEPEEEEEEEEEEEVLEAQEAQEASDGDGGGNEEVTIAEGVAPTLAATGVVNVTPRGRDGRANAEALRVWLSQREPDSPCLEEMLPAASHELRAAMRYSRALYANESLEQFPLDNSRRDHESIELLFPPRLRSQRAVSVGDVAIADIEKGGGVIQRHRAVTEAESVCRTLGSGGPAGSGGSECRKEHLSALRRVAAGERAAAPGSWAAARPLLWADVLIARRYDAACRILLQSALLPTVSPAALFDGLSFYKMVGEARLARPGEAIPRPLALATAGAPPPKLPATATTAAVDPAAYGSMPRVAGGRRVGAGECAYCGQQCGDRILGQYDDSGDGSLYCMDCWRTYEERDDSRPAHRSPPPPPPPPSKPLPVEEFEPEIIRRVAAHRVCVISGETGCGKSSRVPIMLLRAASGRNDVRIMVAQPRRLAAHSLHKRAVEMGHGPLVGLRMQGVSTQGAQTRVWYATTGYMARLIGHRPEAFARLSHVIIDECHERSVDADVLCLLCRRLLADYPRLHLVLMSATAHNELLRGYFASTLGWPAVSQPLHVGSRRFPIEISHLDDLCEVLMLPNRLMGAAKRMVDRCNKAPRDELAASGTAVSSSVISSQIELAVWVVRLEAERQQMEAEQWESSPSILVFVPGIAAVEDLVDELQESPAFRVIPIHSSLDMETQLAAFEPAPPGVTKVIAATNAAESSITLPDCDLVIDLGVEKSVFWNGTHGASELRRGWISKASATQRAGRTGRVRPGRVYRLYPLSLFEALPEYNVCEMSHQPLENTLLQLRSILPAGSSVRELLSEAIEPPADGDVLRGLVSLASSGILDAGGDDALLPPDRRLEQLDRAGLTSTGKLAAALPLDHTLSRLVAIGIALDCTAEAIVIAAGVSVGRSVFRNATPLVIEDPDEYNSLVRLVSHGRRVFDGGLYSDPLALIGLVVQHARVPLEQKKSSKGQPQQPQQPPQPPPPPQPPQPPQPQQPPQQPPQHPQPPGATAAGAGDADSEEEEYETDGLGGEVARVRVRVEKRWCEHLGVAPRLLRRLLNTIEDVKQVLAQKLKLQPAKLQLPTSWPPRGPDGLFKVHVLRAMLVWSFPSHLIRASLPGAGVANVSGMAGDDVGTGPPHLRAQPVMRQQTLSNNKVNLATSLTDDQLQKLLPPSPTLRYSVQYRRCEVIQLARATAAPLSLLRAAVEDVILPMTRPSWVFCQTPDHHAPSGRAASRSNGATLLQIWVDCERLGELEAGLRLFGALLAHTGDGDEPAVLDGGGVHEGGISSAQLRAASGAAVSYSLNNDDEEEGAEGEADGNGSVRRYAYVALRLHLHRGQQKELDRFRSRRGVAIDAETVDLRVHEDQKGTLVVSNCGATLSSPCGGRLTPEATAILGAMCGGDVQARLTDQGESKQTLVFEAEGTVGAEALRRRQPRRGGSQQPHSADGEHAGLASAESRLMPDRPWGMRLLALMAAGHRDRTLRVKGADGKAMPIKTDASEGLRWELGRLRVLLPRSSVLKVAHLAAEDAGLSTGASLWAVGTSMMVLGNDMVAVESPTFLPAGNEWLALVMRARASMDGAGHGALAMVGEGLNEAALNSLLQRVVLSSGQLQMADTIRDTLDLHALQPQRAALDLLREAFEPWTAVGALADEACVATDESAEEPCPICLLVVHTKSFQRPRLRCATCKYGMHATCIYRWLSQQSGPGTLALGQVENEAKCPLCRSPL